MTVVAHLRLGEISKARIIRERCMAEMTFRGGMFKVVVYRHLAVILTLYDTDPALLIKEVNKCG